MDVSFAFGLTVLTMAYAIGHISGCHLNPAVSIGLAIGKRFPMAELPHSIAAQVVGEIAGAGTLLVIASGKSGFDVGAGFASNGFEANSPGGYSMMACLTAEVVLKFFFLMIILGSTDKRAPGGFAPIAIGLGLTLIHLNWHPGHQFERQSGAQHRAGDLCRRVGSGTVVAFLDRADCGCGDRGRCLPGDCQRAGSSESAILNRAAAAFFQHRVAPGGNAVEALDAL